MKYTGKIIILAFPDTFVKMSNDWLCKILPLAGLGTKTHIKAGHAALVLIENETGNAQYFDFGRYITPDGFGRARSAETDVELKLPFKAKFTTDFQLSNMSEMLFWLEANPQKTHGAGRLLASVCDKIDFEKAQNYISMLQSRGNIPYSVFDKNGSNCSRFVTETLLAATDDKKVLKALQFNKKFTPSTVGNVEKGSTNGKILEVINGEINHFKSSALKENLTNYFDKNTPESTILPRVANNKFPKNAQLLTGIGSCAWFEISELNNSENLAKIKRYNDVKELDFEGIFKADSVLDFSKPFTFTYPSHCAICTILQDEKIITLQKVPNTSNVNSYKKVHSA